MKTSGAILLLLVVAILCGPTKAASLSSAQMDCSMYKKYPVNAIPCPITYLPVCGNNYITYGNECHLCTESLKSNGKIKFLHNGNC
ncbi:serine protease inhibitor Kazal-type 7-like isoform X1 [Ornithorhynchus anatinus]|uniref:serine protease inhibitor Kazal-type 7-like isoform X1 n=1 Tax=Ornithorhynchus anatinus TaxID=9258 RepID=UPI0001554A85|nr:serine protease inhibitor Kazal-type 7-like isoform X1 [Ornithorhynchus anatinus]